MVVIVLVEWGSRASSALRITLVSTSSRIMSAIEGIRALGRVLMFVLYPIPGFIVRNMQNKTLRGG